MHMQNGLNYLPLFTRYLSSKDPYLDSECRHPIPPYSIIDWERARSLTLANHFDI